MDVIGAGAIIASAAALVAPLPELPAQGVVVAEAKGVAFHDFSGRRLAAVSGLRFFGQDTNVATGLPRFRDARARLWRVDRANRRFVPAPTGLPLAAGAELDFVRRSQTWLVDAMEAWF